MAYMERLGLWGSFSSFPSFPSFVQAVQRRGVGGLEMLAMEMKASGCYVCRGLSYASAEFELLRAPLSPKQRALYDGAALFWSQRLLPALLAAAERNAAAPGQLVRAYWGAHQRFFKQLCVSLKVPALTARANEALQAGQCVVIGLQASRSSSCERQTRQTRLLICVLSTPSHFSVLHRLLKCLKSSQIDFLSGLLKCHHLTFQIVICLLSPSFLTALLATCFSF